MGKFALCLSMIILPQPLLLIKKQAGMSGLLLGNIHKKRLQTFARTQNRSAQ